MDMNFMWRMAKAGIFAFLAGGNLGGLYLMAKAVVRGDMADTPAAGVVGVLVLVAFAIFVMCALHEIVEAVCERKRRNGRCA